MNTRQCCSKETKNEKFCSSSCAAKVNNSNRKKHKENFCLSCSAKITSSKYCNTTCQMNFQQKVMVEQWQTNGVKSVSRAIRRFLINQAEQKCTLCGWNEINQYTNVVPLEVDHIDGDHTNNHIDNLRVICPNCHSLTFTYKGANKGRGRKNRKKYYALQP